MSYSTRSVFRPARRGAWLALLFAALISGCTLTPSAAEPTPPGTAATAVAGATAQTEPTFDIGTLPTPSEPEEPTSATRSTATARPSGQAPSTPLTVPAVTGDQPVLLTGTFTYSNDIITEYYVEHSIMLGDMYGFVTRDKEWELPVQSQVLGYLDLDEQEQQGTFLLHLPARPVGTQIDLSKSNKPGVQIFAVTYAPNLLGGPFFIGDDRTRGWPSYLASTRNDPENEDEVIGGELVVWAPDAAQQFPTGFGDDNKLFTGDDPLGTLPAGYSVIDLDQQPFGIRRAAEEKLTLYEPKDAAIKDFSDLSYSQAFERMFQQVRTEYAFSDVPGKSPDWDTLGSQLRPRIAEAEQQRDPEAFYAALRDFANAFSDGHVGVSGGDFFIQDFRARFGGGYGLALRELDDGSAIVTYVTADGSADRSGISVGAEIISWDGKPIKEAIDAVDPLEGPFSTDFGKRYQQQRYLVRAPRDTTVEVRFRNSGGQSPRTVTLTAEQELSSYFASDATADRDPNALPVEYQLLSSGVGYVRINSNNDDLNLLIRLFERALKTFRDNEAPGIIIDLRINFGGSPLGLAAFLTDQTIPLGQSEYYSEATGKFEPEGLPDEVIPNEEIYRFDKIALLVNHTCYSACEIEAYAFSKVPGAQVVGEFPTAGVFAEVARGQYRLPEDLSFQVPTGRTLLPDGSILLEGKGVEPTVRIPLTAENVLSEDDVALQRAEEVVLGR
ncbi:MAG TPA: S41 family peptidase [Roseiflexaceae bacterium]|nr:S41 family peptidase [Roseiflexaceae bacterium]